MPGKADLTVQIGALRLANPIIAASGTFGYGVEFAHLVDLNALGGFVVKGLSLEPMTGAPAPRLCETPSGMLNAVGLQNIGVRAFVKEKLPSLRSYRTAVVVNVFGRSVQEYTEVARILEDAEGVAAYELNVSCPNTARGGVEFGAEPGMLAEVLKSVRAVAKRPLWVKLSPNVSDIRPFARVSEEMGAAAITVANTYQGMSVDIRTRKSRVGRATGGLSGPAIRPLTLRLVHEAFQEVKIPVIGLGGIERAEHVVEYLMVGASAVQVGTANFADPRACERIIRDLKATIYSINTSRINELIGAIVLNSG